ncbi:MAG: hypothetical protein U0X40_04265 [Ferruginibacter sp.]
MKKIFTLLCAGVSLAVQAQTKQVSQAVITTKTVITAPEDDENQSGTSTSAGPNGEEIRVVRFGGEGETKSTTTIKNDLVKTFSESEMGRTTVIRDNNKKITTTIMEIMGRKMGSYATDEDQALINKRIDSMMRSRRNDGSLVEATSAAPPKIDFVYQEETRKIAGYECKKALMISTRAEQKKSDTTVVWYLPDTRFQGVTTTGGPAGPFGGMRMQGTDAWEKLNGFPMQYERNLNRGRKMSVQVTKLVIGKEIDDKEFEIPKDVELKSAKDMQNGNGPGIQLRFGN